MEIRRQKPTFPRIDRMALLTGILMILVCLPATSYAWLFFSKPAYQGRVVDLETGAPLEGAAVVAIYYAEALAIGDSGMERAINVQETVTDQEGRFHIPAYSTLIAPNSWASDTYFIVYKPGYTPVDDMNLEGCLTGECKTNRVKWIRNMDKVREFSTRKVALSPLESKSDRRMAMPSRPLFHDKSSFKILVEIINAERKELGLKGTIK